MRNVVFVAPYLMDATLRFVRGAVAVNGARVVLLTEEPEEKVPQDLRALLHGHWRQEGLLDHRNIVTAVTEIARRMGTVSRLIGMLEQAQVAIGKAREELGIDGMDARTAERFRDKGVMKDVLRAAGIPCARHRKVADEAEALAFAAEAGFPLVVKPPAGAGAKSTFRVETNEELVASVRACGAGRGREVQVEEFIVGDEHSFDTVTIHGKPVWHSLSHYDPSPLHVVENPWIQWCVMVPREVDHPRYDDIRKVAFRALDALGMKTGISHMEWFRRKDGSLAVGEVGCRPPGAQFCTLHSYAHDFDLYAAWGRLVIFDQFAPPERKYAAGAAYLRGQGKDGGRVAFVRGLEAAQKEIGHLVVESRIPRVGQSASSTYEGEGYVIVRHPETEVVRHALRRLVTLVRVGLE